LQIIVLLLKHVYHQLVSFKLLFRLRMCLPLLLESYFPPGGLGLVLVYIRRVLPVRVIGGGIFFVISQVCHGFSTIRENPNAKQGHARRRYQN
jgi:hypothetical protein